MFGRLAYARKRRLARTAVPVTAAALLVALLPTQALALPPDPAKEDVGRQPLVLEELKRETRVPSAPAAATRRLERLKALIPPNLTAPPPGTVTPPSNVSGSVTFGSTTTPGLGADVRGHRRADGTDPGRHPARQPGPGFRAAGPDGHLAGDDSGPCLHRRSGHRRCTHGGAVPDTGSVPVSVKLDYARFESLYGADWASRLRLVQFPECYLTTPDDEACQTYEELESSNDTASKSVTATVDPAADGTVTPASASSDPAPGSGDASGPGVVQAAYRTSSSATPAAAGDTAVVGAMDSGAGNGGSFKATPLASDGKWEVAGSSGAFVWEYPLTVPSPPAGPAPRILHLQLAERGRPYRRLLTPGFLGR
ncbi:hypothetical protein SGLAM104S_06024 [Streptomyces glaucescens]